MLTNRGLSGGSVGTQTQQAQEVSVYPACLYNFRKTSVAEINEMKREKYEEGQEAGSVGLLADGIDWLLL